MTKPKLKLKDRLLQIVVIVAATAIALLLTNYVSFLTAAEQFMDDLRIATFRPPEPQSDKIIILAINEDTLSRFPYRTPVDRKFIADTLKLLEERQVKAIALDVLLDQDTEPEKDDLLKETIRNLKVPLTISFTDDPDIENETQLETLNDYVPAENQVRAELPTDADTTVRSIFPGEKSGDGTWRDGFARGLLKKIGVETPPVKVDMVWHGAETVEQEPFPTYPSHLLARLPPALFKDKIVLFGSVESLNDRHRTPLAAAYAGNKGKLAGIEIHAHAISQLLEGRKMLRLSLPQEILFVFVFAIIGGILGGMEMGTAWRISGAVAAVGAIWAGGFLLYKYTAFMTVLVSPTIGHVLALWGAESLTGREAKKQREFIQGAFSRYLSPKVVNQLVEDPSKLHLEGEQKEMTFIFTDLADFTKFAEKMNSKELASLLNIYLDGMVAVVESHDGTVDKFIGDAIFAIFNAPLDQPDHCERAVRCALDIDKFSEAFRKEHYEKAGLKLGITRVGVNTGQAVIGNFGSSKRQEYTALGDPVNTASRLEGVNKQFGTRLCVSQTTYQQCKNIKFRPIAVIAPKGKSEFLPIYEPLSEERAQSDFIKGYMEAYGRCERKEEGALDMFHKLYETDPDDGPTNLHRNRLLANEVGVAFALTEK